MKASRAAAGADLSARLETSIPEWVCTLGNICRKDLQGLDLCCQLHLRALLIHELTALHSSCMPSSACSGSL